MRSYFATIGDSAHPDHEDSRVRAITNFQELLGLLPPSTRCPSPRRLTPVRSPSVVAFREFSVITEETIVSERKRFRTVIADEIEKFSKRAAVRNLKTTGKFSKDDISIIYECVLCLLTHRQVPLVRDGHEC